MDTTSVLPTVLSSRLSICLDPIVGSKINRLSVVTRASNFEGSETVYRCVCECGRKCNVNRQSIIQKRIESCGCYYKGKDRVAVTERHLYGQSILYNSKLLGLESTLTLKEFRNLIYQPCHYCGSERTSYIRDDTINKHHNNSRFVLRYNGVDRIDSSLGYVQGNVLPCCRRCNTAKNDRTFDEFKKWVKVVHNNYLKKNCD